MKRSIFAILTALLLTSCTGLDAGWRAQRSGDYEEAQKQAILALSKDPKNPEVYHLVATTALSQGQYERALKAAQFASSLDGGSAKSEALVREAAHAKKDWKTLCDAGLNAHHKGLALDKDDLSRFSDGYQALLQSFTGDGYGCGLVLANAGTQPENWDMTKARYAETLAQNGQTKEALEIEETVEDPSISQLAASRRLFALNRSQEAEQKLKLYALSENLNETEKENRLTQAAAVCEDFRRYGLESELLSHSVSADNEISYAIALRKNGQTEASDDVFKKHFSRENRTPTETLSEVRRLLNAGYVEQASEAYESCIACTDADDTFTVADLLVDNAQNSSALRILSKYGDDHAEDTQLQKRLFYWYRQNNYTAQALGSGERAVDAGLKDDEFYGDLLETYIDGRELKTYLEKSPQWLASFPEPALEARTRIAQIEVKRKNWPGAMDVLKPLDEKNVLTGTSLSLYIQGLKTLRDYEHLYTIIEKYKSDLDPLKKADYFLNPDAEKQYRQCLEPLLKGSPDEKFSGELALASFLYDYVQDDAGGDEAINRALESSGKTSNSYNVIVNFLKDRTKVESALNYAQKWHQDWPQDDRACSTIGRIYLSQAEVEPAGEWFKKYVDLNSNKYSALRFGYQEFTRFNETEAGLKWIEEVTQPVLSQRQDPPYLKALAESQYETYLTQKSADSHHARRLQNKALDNYRSLLKVSPESAQSIGVTMTSLDAWSDAADAFDIADKQGVKWSKGQRNLRAKAAIRAGRSEQDIRKIIQGAENTNEIFELANLFESEQHPEYGVIAVESLLNDKSVDTRIKAFRYLNNEARAQGDISKLSQYADKLEKSGSNNPDVRMVLAESAIERADWDNATRHLTWLQAQRPDARDVMIDELMLARRAPDHNGAQSLMKMTQESAEGVYHRLDWMAQYYLQIGDYPKAMDYTEKAHHASTIRDYGLEFRLLQLYLKTGTYDTTKRDEARQLIDSLKNSSLWNVEKLQELAKTAQSSGYYEEAQIWMKEAINLAPDQPNLKSKRLEMALDAESEGQILLGLEKALEPPVAEVIAPLKTRNHVLDIADTVDSFIQIGEHDMAASSLLWSLPIYLQTRGVVTTRRLLQDEAYLAKSYRSKVASVLTQQDLLGDSPCDALNWMDNLTDPQVWARLTMRCPDAQDNIFSAITGRRSELSRREQANFDQTYYDTMISLNRRDLGQIYAETMGMTIQPNDAFESAVLSGSGLEALRILEETSIQEDDQMEFFRMLIDHSYTSETIDYIKTRISSFPEDRRSEMAAMALLLGSKDESFIPYIQKAQASTFESLDKETVSSVISLQTLKKYLSDTESSKLDAVFGIAMSYAAGNPDQKTSVFEMVRDEISRRSNQVSIRLSVSQRALSVGFYDFALEQLEPVKQAMPSSDFVYRVISVAEAGLNQESQAKRDLMTGAGCTSNLSDYWQRSLEEHENSSVSIRQFILNARMETEPRNPLLLAQAAALSLEAGDLDSANQYAQTAWQYGKNSVVSALADSYEKAGVLDKLPESVITGTSAQSLELQARCELAKGNLDEATQKYLDAASRAPAPFDVYQRGIEQMLAHKNIAQAEHLIEKWSKDWPHSYMADAYKSVLSLHNGHTDNAWKDYETARSKAISTSPWVSWIIRATAQKNQLDFAQRLYQSERTQGSFDPESWLEALLDLYLSENEAKLQNLSPDAWAKQGITFIEQLIPTAGYVVRKNEPLRTKMLHLAVKAHRTDWIQRLSAAAL